MTKRFHIQLWVRENSYLIIINVCSKHYNDIISIS
jgi:hypothetical protein